MRPRIAAVSIVAAMTAVTFAALSVNSARAYQHIANGGFESGLTGWSVAPGANAAIAADDPAEGSAHLRLTIGSTAPRVEHTAGGALAPGAYQVSLKARRSSAVTVRLSIQPTGQPRFGVADDTVGASWTPIGGAFTLNEAASITLIIVADAAPGATVDIDDVRLDGASPVTLTPTPTPALHTATPVAGPAISSTSTLGSSTPPPSPTTTTLVDAITDTLRNAGFEELDSAGLPFAWEKYGGTLATDPQARGGARAARLDSATASTKWLHQTVTVNGGRWYGFDAWVLNNHAGVSSAFLRISWYPTADGSGEAIDTVDSMFRLDTPELGYRQLTTGAVQAPATARSARARIMLAPRSDAPASILVDDAWFGPSSPPPLPAATPSVAVLDGTAGVDGSHQAANRDHTDPERTSATRSSTSASAITSGAQSASGIVINEILYDADLPDIPDPGAEWIELYNAGDAPIDLGGYSLRDGSSIDQLPPLAVPARGFAIVAAGDAFQTAYPALDVPTVLLDGRIGNALGNDGDRLLLVDPSGAVVDAVSWGDDVSAFDPSIADVPAGHSLERRFAGVDSNMADDFVDNERPSPGLAYAIPGDPKRQNSSGSVRIIEGGGASQFAWVPWALAATAGAVCAATLGWRTVENARRARHP